MTHPFPFDTAVDRLEADHKLVESMFLELLGEGADAAPRRKKKRRKEGETDVAAPTAEKAAEPPTSEGGAS